MKQANLYKRKIWKEDPLVYLEIPYTLSSSQRARKLRITVRTDGTVRVTKPYFVSRTRAEAFVASRRGWIEAKLEYFRLRPQKILAHYSVKDFKENKEKAYELIQRRVLYFNQFYKHPLGKIYIKNQKTRWGSCSGKKNLSFNYKVLFLPDELRDYIIVHELCHLKEMNHSKKFWDLVASKIPDHKTYRQKIKLY